jgi:hypothetical protein
MVPADHRTSGLLADVWVSALYARGDDLASALDQLDRQQRRRIYDAAGRIRAELTRKHRPEVPQC